MDRKRLADHNEISGACAAWKEHIAGPGSARVDVTSARTSHGESSARECALARRSTRQAAISLEVAGRNAPGDSLWRVDWYSGLSRATLREDCDRTGGRLPANQTEGEAGLGCERSREGSVTLGRHYAERRC